jgi:hypothetical protein
MSTYSDAWHNMDPDLRNFYVNWSQINCAQCWHNVWWPQYDFWEPINLWAQSLQGYLGFHVAQRNWGVQQIISGSFDKNYCKLQIPAFGTSGLVEPAYDSSGATAYYSFCIDLLDYSSINIYVDPPTDPPTEEDPIFYGYPLPRLKYKIRKSYWTGAPRRRRNLV